MTDELRRLARIKANLERRAIVCESVRGFFHHDGFLEVETPVMVSGAAPEQHIAPFAVNGRFLSTSPEMHMKRLLAAEYGNIFQICHCFRKEERGSLHNPEFTMLEWYRVGADYMKIIEDTERLVLAVARDLGTGTSLHYQGKDISLVTPWPRVKVRDAYLGWAGWDPVSQHEPVRFDVDFVEKVLPNFSDHLPTVLMDYPAANASMARLHASDPTLAERAEVFIGGLELANAYSELTDTADLEARFRWENKQLEAAGHPQMPLPGRFLEAMASLPPCGGNALGVDRLVMLFCDAKSIDEVVAFPHELA